VSQLPDESLQANLLDRLLPLNLTFLNATNRSQLTDHIEFLQSP